MPPTSDDAQSAPVQTLTDAALVRRCRADCDSAWAELVDRYARYVHAIAKQGFRLCDEDAEDIFQDVFARTYEHLGRLRDDQAIRPWIGQLTRRRCIDQVRLRGREVLTDETVEPRGAVDPLDRLADAIAVRDAMRALPDHSRDILDRFFARDESYQTIAGDLRIPAGTIASRISRGLTMLRDELGEDVRLAA